MIEGFLEKYLPEIHQQPILRALLNAQACKEEFLQSPDHPLAIGRSLSKECQERMECQVGSMS